MDAALAEHAAPTPAAATPADLTHWLLTEGRMTDRFVDFWRGFSERLAAAGVPAWRVSLHMMTLHPEIRAAAYFYWAEDGRVEREEYAHRTANSGQYLHSPIRVLVEGRAAEVRHRLCDLAPPYPYPVFEELAAKGATDYVLIGLPLVTGRQAAIGLVSTAPGGFTEAQIATLRACFPALAAVLEGKVARLLATQLLDIYVGREAGARILDGAIVRGTARTIRAVLWYCDLRGFTELADSLPGDALVSVLNRYFEAMGRPVLDEGGDILKFIGDAMLAIFPVPDGVENLTPLVTRSVLATQRAVAAMAALNAEQDGPQLKFGIGLHLGEVLHGNIGTPSRLDFTVIGPAVNLVTRLEGLCRRLDRPVLFSSAIRAACPNLANALQSLGAHPVKGVAEPLEVYGLPEAMLEGGWLPA